MLAPNNVNVPELARETGIPKDTLYTWRVKHRKANADATAGQVPSGGLSGEDTFAVVVETATEHAGRRGDAEVGLIRSHEFADFPESVPRAT